MKKTLESRIKKIERRLNLSKARKVIVPDINISDKKLEQLKRENPGSIFVLVESVPNSHYA